MKDEIIQKDWVAIDFSIHAILSGVLMNGWLQGKDNRDINIAVIDVALKEIKKVIK
jgi:hypothetical protein